MMSAHLPLRKTATTVATLLLLLALSSLSFAQAESAGDIWLVNTRQAAHSGAVLCGQDKITFHRSEDACAWESAGRADFVASCSGDVPVVVFVHGNRTDNAGAIEEAMDVYCHLKRAAGRPFRFVIWSWPSEMVERHYRPDVWLKNVRSDADAFYLAELLQACDADVRVSLIGYSLGARVIGGGLHLLGGGSVAGRSLGAAPCQRAPMRAVLIAAAIDQNAFSAQGCFGRAAAMTDRIVVTVNALDPAMKWYVKLYGCRGARALGWAGPCGATTGGTLRTVELSNCVGRRHRWRYYAHCPALTSLYGNYAFLCD